MSLSSVSTLKLTSPHLGASTGAAVVEVAASSVLQHTPALRVSARRHSVGKYLHRVIS